MAEGFSGGVWASAPNVQTVRRLLTGAAHRRAVRLPANPLPLDATSPTANAPLSYEEKGNSAQNETPHYHTEWRPGME